MEDVEWSLPVGLDVLASSLPHPKTIARTRESGLDMYGAGRGGWIVGGTGAGVKLVLSMFKLNPCPAIRWPGACGAVSVDKRVASKVSCRRWLSADHAVAVDVVVVVAAVARGRKAIVASFDPKNSCHGIYNKRHWLSRVIAG